MMIEFTEFPDDLRPYITSRSQPDATLHLLGFEVQHAVTGEWLPVQYAGTTDRMCNRATLANLDAALAFAAHEDATPKGTFLMRHPEAWKGRIPICGIRFREPQSHAVN